MVGSAHPTFLTNCHYVSLKIYKLVIWSELCMIIRAATDKDIPAIAKVDVDTWRTTYRGIVPDEYLANLSYERRANAWYQSLKYSSEDGNFIYVAEDVGEIVGFADGGPERTQDPIYKGELYAIYILQTYQRKGLGRCLVQTISAKLSRLNIDSMLVWVLADNPACQFYLELGGKHVYEQDLKVGSKALIEKAYGWIDTANLRKY